VQLKVYYTEKKYVEVRWAENKANTITTGWLFSEVLRKII
jgi:hypothetical protein